MSLKGFNCVMKVQKGKAAPPNMTKMPDLLHSANTQVLRQISSYLASQTVHVGLRQCCPFC